MDRLRTPIRGRRLWRLFPCLVAVAVSQLCAQGTQYFTFGTWDAPSGSAGKVATSPSNPAFDFTVASSGNVEIWLKSWNNNRYLYILNSSGSVAAEGTPAFVASDKPLLMTVNLASGNYKVVAASTVAGYIGHFRLSINGAAAGGATLTINPEIKVQPASMTVSQRSAAGFIIKTGFVSGFQWRKNGLNIFGAKEEDFSILSTVSGDQGAYTCNITVGSQSLLSSAANLTVTGYVPTTNTWSPPFFTISAFGAPKLTGNVTSDNAMLTKYRGAGLNFTTGEGFDVYSPWEKFSGTPNSNRYRIGRYAAQAQVPKMMADEERISGTCRPFHAASISAAVADYMSLNTTERVAFGGYSIGDEPWYRKRNGILDDHTTSAGDQLRKLELVMNTDKTVPAWMNLRGFWGFNVKSGTTTPDWNEYLNYVNGFALHKDVKILSFDYYVLNKGSNGIYGPNKGYSGFDNGISYYLHNQTFAQAVRNAWETLGKKVYFFGVPAVVEEKDAPVNPTSWLPKNDDSQMRFNAFAPVIYGAKGVEWYTYVTPAGNTTNYPTSPESDATTLNRMKSVNTALSNLGWWLMQLDWVNTLHGNLGNPASATVTDPFSSEPNLPTLAGANNGYVMPPSHPYPEQYAIGFMKNSITKDDVLLILNKNITPPTGGTMPGSDSWNYFMRGYGNVRQFDNSTGQWNDLPKTYNSDNTTSFWVNNVNPGDVRMIQFKKPAYTVLATHGLL